MKYEIKHNAPWRWRPWEADFTGCCRKCRSLLADRSSALFLKPPLGTPHPHLPTYNRKHLIYALPNLTTRPLKEATIGKQVWIHFFRGMLLNTHIRRQKTKETSLRNDCFYPTSRHMGPNLADVVQARQNPVLTGIIPLFQIRLTSKAAYAHDPTVTQLRIQNRSRADGKTWDNLWMLLNTMQSQ